MESNSVFISYRRDASAHLARAIFQDLRAHTVDVFMDVENIDAGQFGQIILGQIAARPYFLLLLTPGTLERCKEPKDWLRREIEQAMRLKRQIVLLHTPNFRFEDLEKYLEPIIGEELRLFNSIDVPHDYFNAAMERLRERFLKPIELPTTPTPKADRATVQEKIDEVTARPRVTTGQLSAQVYFERAMARNNNSNEELADYDQAIRLNPKFSEAFNSRGAVRYSRGDLSGAIADYDQAISVNPKFTKAYYNRGIAHIARGELEEAIADNSAALYLDPDYAEAYNNRGNARRLKGELDEAIADYDEAIQINPKYAAAYKNRGIAYDAKGDTGMASINFQAALALKPDISDLQAMLDYIAKHDDR